MLLLLAILAGAFFWYVSDYYRAEDVALEVLAQNDGIVTQEDSVIINIEFDGKNGFYSEKKGKQSIYLNTGRISINIYGNIGKKELFRMAENLELLKR